MGKNWAIAIGINNYNNLQPLKYANKDAEAMKDWFRQEARFKRVFLFTDDSEPISQVNPPIPTTPTFGHLRRFLRAQFERPLLKPEDNLWFFFAGHGKRYKDKDYLMLSDSDPGALEHTAISVEYVTQRLRRSGADNVVLFLDACRDEGSRGGLGIGEDEHKGVITFYSCTANQKSWEFDELQHGSFTHALLAGLRLQGEGNCATVERLDRYLYSQVPRLNAHYKKPFQNPYLKAEPPYKMYLILIEHFATFKDAEPLKYQASQAENRGDLVLAKQLWKRVLALPGVDEDAWEAIERIAQRQRDTSRTQSNSQSRTSTMGRRGETSENVIQREEQHQQNLIQYRQKQDTSILPSIPITRKQFLKWAGLGGAGLVTAVVACEIFKQPPLTLEPFDFEVKTVNAEGQVIEQKKSQAQFFKEDLGNNVTLEMVSIPGGKFLMGTEDEEIERLVQKFDSNVFKNEQPQHEVTVQPFFMGKYPITQAQWKAIASLPKIKLDLKPDPSHFKGYHHPVEQVSWEEAVEFCQRLSKQAGKEYRLPTEAEWEYACRAGTKTTFHFGETITSELANYNTTVTYANEPPVENREQTTPVGNFPPNAFGLYDMHGNVWEWCEDDWHDNYQGAPTDGSAWLSENSVNKAMRGGTLGIPLSLRSAYRTSQTPDNSYKFIGFRVVCIALKNT